jgi:hypothetical protein
MLCLVELRGFEPLTPCMPCHPHHFTTPSAALPGTTLALLDEVAGQGALVRREDGCGIAADNLLTGSLAPCDEPHPGFTGGSGMPLVLWGCAPTPYNTGRGLG